MAKTNFSGPIYVNNREVISEDGNIIAAVDLADIRDSNDNEALEIDAVTSAVNYVRLANAATGNNPELSSQGEDTNLSLQLSGKGTGLTLVGDSSTATSAGGSATINTQRGKLTLGGLTANAGDSETVKLLNNKLSTTSQCFFSIDDTQVTGIATIASYNAASGSSVIKIANAGSASALSGTAIINFVVVG